MRRLHALVLVAVVRTAAADPAQAPKRECRPTGRVLFEVDQRADRNAKLTTATTRLFENGAWKTEIFDVDGKLARSRAGCLAATVLAGIRAELRAATWKTTRTKDTCRADQPRSTVYKWKGRLLYTERTCNEEALEESSRHALDLVELLLQAPDDLDAASPTCLDNPLAKDCI